jgi:NTP pyrophosphatase (non-canonical NTP hydrolase)
MDQLMQLPLYRKNVFKTWIRRAIKDAAKYVARDSKRASVLHALIGMATEVGDLFQALQQYLLEGRMSSGAKDAAFEEMGDLGYYLVVTAKMLKVRLPGAGKKIKLVGTRGKALMDLQTVVTKLLSTGKHALESVAEKEVQKAVPARAEVTNKAGKVIRPATVAGTKTVMVLDPEKQKEIDQEVHDQQEELLVQAADLYYRLCYDLFQQPPAAVFYGNVVKLQTLHQGVAFELTAPKAVAKAPAKPVKAAKTVAKKAGKTAGKSASKGQQVAAAA